MSLIDELRALLRPSKKQAPASAADVVAAAGRASAELQETEQRLRQLRRERADVLLLESAEKLEAHERAIQAAERDAERLRGLIPRLRELAAEAQVREAIASIPELAAELPAAVQAVQEAQRAFYEAQGALSRITGALRYRLETALRAKRLSDLPDLDPALEHAVDVAGRTRISVEAGASFSWPRPATPRTDHHVVVHGDGRFTFVGEWTEAERRDWLRKHGGLRPRSFVASDTASAPGTAPGDAAAAARLLAASPQAGASVRDGGRDGQVAARILQAGKGGGS